MGHIGVEVDGRMSMRTAAQYIHRSVDETGCTVHTHTRTHAHTKERAQSAQYVQRKIL